MKATITAALLSATLASALPSKRDVDTTYPYTGPAIPVGDWVDTTVNGNGKGFPRLIEPPAVQPSCLRPTNNVNVISLSYIPDGVNIHYQTPFGLRGPPTVRWGESHSRIQNTASGTTKTYDRTPPCSMAPVTQCSQYFHDVQITGLKPGREYYYYIPASNGTTTSDVLTFKTAPAAGDEGKFTVAVLNDMGYTNAQGTQKYLKKAITEGLNFVWHGGDISYADDWYSGILPCESDWPVCYNGSSTELPGGPPYPEEYTNTPLPAGEIPNQGGPRGGEMSVLYESNWDLWQQWMNSVASKVPYMVLPGNHEASCGEFDGPNNELTALLNNNKPNSTASGKSGLSYYSCPPSQRNFTTFQHRFRMPGSESKGKGNFWYSFDYGLAHFISINTETDFAYSPSSPFVRDDETAHPKVNETRITDAGPFGYITNNDWKNNAAYEQYNWLLNDLKSIDRKKTPWVFVNGHRPMYSSAVSSYQKDVRNAFEALFLKYGVDAYFAGHIHWYERLYPLGVNGTIDTGSIVDNGTYVVNNGKSITHIINGMAGNIESHSEFRKGQGVTPITAVLDKTHYGFSKLDVTREKAVWTFVKGEDGSVGDKVTLLKRKP